MNAITAVKYVFTLIGIVFLACAFFTYRDASDFLVRAEKTEGTVVSPGTRKYLPIFSFTDQNGRLVKFCPSVTNPSIKYTVGQKISVLYLPDNPRGAKCDRFDEIWGRTTFCIGFGSVFFLIGFGIITFIFVNGRKGQYLMKHGDCIESKLQRVEINGSLSANGENPYRIVTKWRDPSTRKTHTFRSDNLWFDPTELINTDTIKVFIKRGNPKKYHVDTSFLPKPEA